MRRFVPHGLLAAAAVAMATACAAPMRVHSYTETGRDIRAFKSFAMGPAKLSETGDPRLDDNPFFMDRVQMNVERQMTGRGYEKTDAGRSDLVVHYHASVNQEIELKDRPRPECANGINPTSPPVGGGAPPLSSCRPYVYDAGTLLIDLVDRKTDKVVWRGWAEGSIDGLLDNQQWMEEHVDAAVAKIMSQLPRRQAASDN